MVSFKPKDQAKASMWEGGPGTLNTLRAVLWDYNGQQDPGPFIHANITSLEDGKEYDEYYGAGDAARFGPSEDGLTFVPKKAGVNGLSDSCNAAHLINSIVGAGFSEDDLEEDLSIFDDMDITWARKKIERKGLSDSNPLLANSIERMPGQPKKAVGKPGAAKAPTGKAAAVPAKAAAPTKKTSNKDAEVAEAAEGYVNDVMSEVEGAISRKSLINKVFAKAKKDPNLKAIQTLVGDKEWLGNGEHAFAYDGDEDSVSLG